MSKIFLDTSYLFPIFGLENNIKGLKDDIHKILDDKVNKYYYSNVSLIEIKWQFIKLEKSREDKLVLQNYFQKYQNILLKDMRFNIIYFHNSDINQISDKIRNQGHTDYFDTVIGATALWHCDYFITEDSSLKIRINKLNEDDDINKQFTVISWKEYLSI